MRPSRKTHKNRYSITHLSTETTATLPEYAPASVATTTTAWQPSRHSRSQHHPAERALLLDQEGLLSDQPPEYPDSADEADEETDSVSSESHDGDNVQVQGRPLLLSPHPHPHGVGAVAAAGFTPSTHSPRHHGKRISLSTSPPSSHHSHHSYHHHQQHYTHPHHRYRQSYNPNRPYLHHSRKFRSTAALPYPDPDPTEDSYLDSLLERSVHALEMSNTLLQSSISTRTSLSALLKTPELESKWVVDEGKGKDGEEEEEERMDKFEERTYGLAKRINVHEGWMDDLEKIKRDVEGLFGDGDAEGSSTLPPSLAYKHQPSQLDLQDGQNPKLTYSLQHRSRLVSPAPGALTHHIAAPGADSDSVTLSSTLGFRASSASQSTVSLHSAPVMPQITDRPLEPTTPAYNMLASFVNRTPPGTASTPASFTTPSVFGSLIPKLRPRASSSSGTDDRRSIDHLRPPTSDRSHGRAPRPMTPPTEVSTGSSSSSEDLVAKKTVLSLRKILDEQPSRPVKKYKPPAFMPITPAPAPQAATSNATASVSRLFTKAIHTSSTRPPSPPKHSALKHGLGSRSSTPAAEQIQPTASTSSTTGINFSSTNWPDINWKKSNLMKAQLGRLPEILSASVAKTFGVTSVMASETNSATSSGRSTPKRISFAELPEVERSESTSLRFREKQKARRRRRQSKGLSIVSANNENGTPADAVESASPPIGAGWWSGWLGDDSGGALAGMGGGNTGMYVSRVEERASRPWSRPGIEFGGDWVV